MKRFFDISISIVILIILIIPMIFIAIAVFMSSKGGILYWSDRVGMNSIIYKMPKFRTMKKNTPEVATHLLDLKETHFTSIGRFLRKYSLDELPQLFSVINGDMSLVGPRPALFNQIELISLRQEQSIDKLLPGITGWAQVNGRDDLTIIDKVSLDEEYAQYSSLWFDIKIIFLTILKVLKREGVAH
jgi:O-antigen biosynthesis protein WbqP